MWHKGWEFIIPESEYLSKRAGCQHRRLAGHGLLKRMILKSLRSCQEGGQKEMDKKALIAKQKNEIRFQENQILYMEGKITWEEFEKELELFEEQKKQIEKIDFDLQELEVEFGNGLISEKDFNIKKEILNNRKIKICE